MCRDTGTCAAYSRSTLTHFIELKEVKLPFEITRSSDQPCDKVSLLLGKLGEASLS